MIRIKYIVFFLISLLAAAAVFSCCLPPYETEKDTDAAEQPIKDTDEAEQPIYDGQDSELPAQKDPHSPDAQETFSPQPLPPETGKEVQLIISYAIKISEPVEKMVLTTTVPEDYLGRQYMKNTTYCTQPSRVFKKGPNTYAEFMFKNLDRDQSIEISTQMILYSYGLDEAAQTGLSTKEDTDFSLYLEPEKYIESDDPIISENSIVVDQACCPVEQIQMIYDYVVASINYDAYNPQSLGAVQALKEGRGDCTEFTDVFVALCRASGFPARSIEGYFLQGENISQGHNWPEVYLERYGWVPFDPAMHHHAETTFYGLANAYVYLSFVRNDPLLYNFHYYCSRTWGGQAEIIKDIQFYLLNENIAARKAWN